MGKALGVICFVKLFTKHKDRGEIGVQAQPAVFSLLAFCFEQSKSGEAYRAFLLFAKKKVSYAMVSSIARETAWTGASPAETRLYSSYIKSAMRCVS